MMLSTLLFVASFSLVCLADAGNNEQTNMMTKVDLLKSIIYDNTKATVTLDSSALKQLIQLSAGNCIYTFLSKPYFLSNRINVYLTLSFSNTNVKNNDPRNTMTGPHFST